MMSTHKTIAIVTGATSGLGRAFIDELEKDPHVEEIWAIARSRDKLAELEQQISKRIRPLAFDLTLPISMNEIEKMLKQRQPTVRYLINNAGFAKFGANGEIARQEAENLIDLNARAVVSLCTMCTPYLASGSKVLNIASLSAFLPLPSMAVYAASKVFVKNYSLALSEELKPHGITVTAVCPGWIDTNLYARAEIGAEHTIQKFDGMVKPHEVARSALADAHRGKRLSVYSLIPKAARFLSAVLPDSVLMRIWQRHQKI